MNATLCPRARLAALTNGPKPWLVTITYESGKVHSLRQPFEASARNYAAAQAGKIGRALIDRETGEIVRIMSVDVSHSPERIDGPLNPPPLPHGQGSWIVRRIATGEVIGEFFDPDNVRKFNQATCEAIPIGEHLASLNGKEKP
jgi:hypothetical protein